MWTVRSFRREQVEYVTKWRSRARCYMGLLCWAIAVNDVSSSALAIRRYGLASVLPMAIIFGMAIVPIGYSELVIGQFSRCGYIKVWRLSPPFKGIGYTCLYILALCTMHNNFMTVIVLHYVRGSLMSPVPWTVCGAGWAKDNCYVTGEKYRYYKKCVQKEPNRTNYCERLHWQRSYVHYWSEVIATEASTISTSGIGLENLLYSLLTACIIFVMLRKGVSSLEQFVTFMCVVPHVLQTILFSVALTLPGAPGAIVQFYVPRLQSFNSGAMWVAVMCGTFTGTNIGLGGNILFGSESADFRTPIHMAALGIYFFNLLFSTLFGLFYCTALSAYAYFDAVPLSSLGAGDGIAVTIRDISIAFLPWPWLPQIWALMYFGSLYVMLLRTKVLVLHAFISGIYHMFPKLVHYYDLCAFMVIFVDCGLSLLNYNRKAVTFMVHKTCIFSNYCTLLVIFYEQVAIMYVYGTSNLIDDIHFMLGFRPSAYWKVCWYLIPLVTLAILGLSCKEMIMIFTQLYNDDKWFFPVGVFSTLACITITPAYMVAYLLRYKKRRKWHKLMRPSALWGPADKSLRKSREMFSAHSMTKEYIYRQQRQSRHFV